MPPLIMRESTILAPILRHVESSTHRGFAEDYAHRWSFENYAANVGEIPSYLHRLPHKDVTVYGYNGFALEISDEKNVRGSRTIESEMTALKYITVAHQFILIQSVRSGRFLEINDRNRVVSSMRPSDKALWFENIKTESHKNFHTLTNRRIAKNGDLCNLAITKRGRVKCKSSIRSKSTSFLPVSRNRRYSV